MSSAVLGFSTPVQILSFAVADDFYEKQLRSDEACYVMEVLQTELDRLRTQKVAQRRKYLKLIRHLNRVHGVLPPSMFLTGLTRESATAVAGGGFADVWIGRLDKQRVCIKVLRFFQQGSDREKLLKALSKEVLLWRQLHHPNILPFLGVNTELFAPSFCIVSPWMSNGDIMAYAQNHSLDLGAKLQHIRQIAEGLLYLHGLDPPVIHGDIKGANILISDDQCCCLADFGLSVLDSQSMNPTVTATVQGSLRWLAPEFINPNPMPTQGKLTSRDIYAFGCTVFEILTGQPPFPHHNLDISVAIDVLRGVRPVLLSAIVPKEDVFKLIRSLLDSCWAEEITHRPDAQTVHDFLNHIVHTSMQIPELEYFPSLLPVLNGASGITHSDLSGYDVGHDINATPRNWGFGTNAVADALNPVKDSYTYSNAEALSATGNFQPASRRAAPFAEVLAEPLNNFFPINDRDPDFPSGSNSRVKGGYTYSNAEAFSVTGNSHCSSKRAAPFAQVLTEPLDNFDPVDDRNPTFPSGLNSSTLDQDGSATRAVKRARGMTAQPSPHPRFTVSSPPVVPRSTLQGPASHQSLSPWTYKLTPEDADGVAQDEIFTPFDEDDGDDEIVWDPRPNGLTILTPIDKVDTGSPGLCWFSPDPEEEQGLGQDLTSSLDSFDFNAPVMDQLRAEEFDQNNITFSGRNTTPLFTDHDIPFYQTVQPELPRETLQRHEPDRFNTDKLYAFSPETPPLEDFHSPLTQPVRYRATRATSFGSSSPQVVTSIPFGLKTDAVNISSSPPMPSRSELPPSQQQAHDTDKIISSAFNPLLEPPSYLVHQSISSGGPDADLSDLLSRQDQSQQLGSSYFTPTPEAPLAISETFSVIESSPAAFTSTTLPEVLPSTSSYTAERPRRASQLLLDMARNRRVSSVRRRSGRPPAEWSKHRRLNDSTAEPPVAMSEVASGSGGSDSAGRGGLSWANPLLWQSWKEYRDRQGQFESSPLLIEDSAFGM